MLPAVLRLFAAVQAAAAGHLWPMKCERILKEIERFLCAEPLHSHLLALRENLPDETGLYLAGGAVRNLVIGLLHGNPPPIEDVDLFLSDPPPNFEARRLLPAGRLRFTDLGGVRWEPKGDGLPLDICLLPQFVIIKKYSLQPNLNTLLNTIDFTMNALAYDMRRQVLHCKNAVEDIGRRLLAFNTRLFYTRTATAYRVLLLRHKTRFHLSEAVFDFIKNAIDLEVLLNLKRILTVRLGKRRMEGVLEDYDRICACVDYRQYRQLTSHLSDPA
jgi:hypothetical protein